MHPPFLSAKVASHLCPSLGFRHWLLVWAQAPWDQQYFDVFDRESNLFFVCRFFRMLRVLMSLLLYGLGRYVYGEGGNVGEWKGYRLLLVCKYFMSFISFCRVRIISVKSLLVFVVAFACWDGERSTF